MRTAVYFCQTEPLGSLDISAIGKYAANLPGVETVVDLGNQN